ncbi:probable enoyl-CoA hydratase 2, mitochondrial isoform X2 [Arachis hypogaea]|uniref:probable enoyl-CoA hydratase 2, mitochondrial isoform X2 n=1 Tax=Arachis hypogaea TaxID=3818 RepID=UPI000DED337C
MRGLKHVLELINQDSSTNVAIVTSSVPGVYCTGADLKERKAFIAFEVREYSKALCAIFSFLKIQSVKPGSLFQGYSWKITTSKGGYSLHELLKDRKIILSEIS